MERKVYWSVLKERTVLDHAANAIELIAMHAGAAGYTKLTVPYMRVDSARNTLATKFMRESDNPDDVLVMLDDDHVHPVDIIEQLIDSITPRVVDDGSARVGVIGALAFMRGEPFSPCFFARDESGTMRNVAVQEADGIYQGHAIGHAAIAIARWVFEELEDKGFHAPYWRYTYEDGVRKKKENGMWTYADGALHTPSEDMYFCGLCEKAEIYVWCDMRLETPHIILSTVNKRVWQGYIAEKPDLILPKPHYIQEMIREPIPTPHYLESVND